VRVAFPKVEYLPQRVADFDAGSKVSLADLVGRTIERAHLTGGEWVVLELSKEGGRGPQQGA
jgi:hypothetical protein